MTAPPTISNGSAASPSELLSRVQAHVRELLGEDDPEFTQDLVSSFCSSVGGLCDRVEAAMAAGDFQRVAAGAHQIKGSAANVGLRRIAEDWHAVEQAARRCDPAYDRRGSIEDYDGPERRADGPDRRAGSLARGVQESILTARHVAATLGG